MKTFARAAILTAVIEVALALYHVPIANGTMLLVTGAALFVFALMAQIIFALLKDRQHERQAWKEVALSQTLNGHGNDTQRVQMPDYNTQLIQAGFSMLAESQAQTNNLLQEIMQRQFGPQIVNPEYYRELPEGEVNK